MMESNDVLTLEAAVKD
jgi:hypothetical protein